MVKGLSLADRFWTKVDKKSPDECWEYTAYKEKAGYGWFWISDDSGTRAHRVSYELSYGPFDKSLLVLHKCDNRGCVNPDHLFLGTQHDNVQDMIAKGRRSKLVFGAKGEANRSAKLTENDVRDIKSRLSAGQSNSSIAKIHGVGSNAILRIKTGRAWSWFV